MSAYHTHFDVKLVGQHTLVCSSMTEVFNNRPQNSMDVESVLNSIKKSLRSSQNLSDKHLCVSLGKKCLFFGKFGVLFSCNTRFEICLLPYNRQFGN